VCSSDLTGVQSRFFLQHLSLTGSNGTTPDEQLNDRECSSCLAWTRLPPLWRFDLTLHWVTSEPLGGVNAASVKVINGIGVVRILLMNRSE
jgi:hypothetical protein